MKSFNDFFIHGNNPEKAWGTIPVSVLTCACLRFDEMFVVTVKYITF